MSRATAPSTVRSSLRVPFLPAGLLLCSLFVRPLFAQSIFTVAGGGPIGDGQAATQAVLRLPRDTVIDAGGNLYIADEGNLLVRRVDARTGVITTVAGGGTSGLGDGGPATAAEVRAFDLVLTPQGDLLIANGYFVRKINLTSGIITTIAGGGNRTGDGIPPLEAAINVFSLALDRSGNLYLANEFAVDRIDARTGLLSRFAGTGDAGYAGDGGPARAAKFKRISSVETDAAGNVLIADTFNRRVRRVDAATGIITTFLAEGFLEDGVSTAGRNFFPNDIALDSAGNIFVVHLNGLARIDSSTGLIYQYAGAGGSDFLGDGGPASKAAFNFAVGITFDAGNNLYVADSRNHRIRRINASGSIINTVAGAGASRADEGAPATTASLFTPSDVAVDAQGNLYIAEEVNYRVRKFEASTGQIFTVAGTGLTGFAPNGGVATQTRLREVYSVAVDSKGNLIIVSSTGYLWKVDAPTGVMTRIAGSAMDYDCCFGGDGGLATAAKLSNPEDATVDADGNIFIADSSNHRVRKIAAASGIITTVAGSGPTDSISGTYYGFFAGDGGPATEARLNLPRGVAVDKAGNLYIADTNNHRVRRVAAASGIITTFAGNGQTCCYQNEGLLATAVPVPQPEGLAFTAAGDLLIGSQARVLRVDLASNRIYTIAGNGSIHFGGDGGLATRASVGRVSGLAVDAKGNVFLSDYESNRIRAVFACVNVSPPALATPNDGASGTSTAPTLSWSKIEGAFRYDVFLDTRTPPGRFAAQDLEAPSLTVANLLPATKYFWKVNAKGDPFCPSPSIGPSEIRSFTTTGGCQAPGAFSLGLPNDGEASVTSSPALSWSASSGAGSYDVYLGAANPPPLLSSTTSTSIAASGLAAGTRYFWQVVAHASCDASQTARTPIRSFTVSGGCAAAGGFAQVAPTPGATNVPTTTTLEWSPSANATSYDLYLGTTGPPPIYLLDLSSTTLDIAGLFAGKSYFWRVVAKVACDSTRSVSTGIAQFTTRGDCPVPGPTSILFTPPGNVGVGQTYVIAWSLARGLDANGSYLVERSLSASFSPLVDSQLVMIASASFIATTPGAYYHRVKAVAGCDPNKTGPYSDPKIVNVVSGTPNVIFTIQPRAVITNLGEKLEDKKTTFTLENISTSTVQLILGKAEISSSPFFTVTDPFGGDSVFVTLEPRKPKSFELHFSGPANDQSGSYQGIVFASAPGAPIIPYAFVNLKVGSGGSATPRFTSGGTTSEYAFFPGLAGDDSSRAPITVTINNPGSTPMEVGAEIGPEVWLVPEAGWNATAIPPQSSRDVRLFTKRNRAPNGSALPRYTYFTVRTRSGESARLLVQDNDAPPLSSGRGAGLDPAVRSFIVPDVGSTASSATGATLVSRLRLSNVGSDAAQLTLYLTPKDRDGFDGAAVKTVVIVAPPNDVVTLTDPLVQLFGLIRPAAGQIEVRAAPEKLGLVTVSSGIVSLADPERTLVSLPTLWRGEGARSGSPHRLPGISSTPVETSGVVLVETSGVDAATVRLDLYDKEGALKGTTSVVVPRYGQKQIDDIAAATGAGTIDGGKIRLTVESGGGSVTGVGKIRGRTSESAASFVSQAEGEAASGAKAYARVQAAVSWNEAIGMLASVVPFVPSGPTATNLAVSYSTLLGLGAPLTASATFTMTFTDGTGRKVTKTVTVPAVKTIEYKDVVKDLFGIAEPAQGTLLIQATPGGQVYSRVTSLAGLVTEVNGAVPVVPTTSQGLTSLLSGGQRPLYLDGLEQSTDPTRGSSWSLYLNEVRGQSGEATVRLFEAGNRSTPIAEKTVTLTPLGQVRLEPLFSAMELVSAERLKDRTNMMVMVTAKSGSALVSATAVATDNRTGQRKTYSLAPSSGLPASGEALAAAAVVPPKRGRGARRP